MTKLALYVQLDAKPGKEKEVEDFLKGALPLVEAEPGTTTWFAMKMGPATFGIFDTFENEGDREAHLSGDGCEGVDGEGVRTFCDASGNSHDRHSGEQASALGMHLRESNDAPLRSPRSAHV